MAKKKKDITALRQAAYDYVNAPITQDEADWANSYMHTINEGRKETAPLEYIGERDLGGRGFYKATQGAVDTGKVSYKDVNNYFSGRKRDRASDRINGIGKRKEFVDSNGNYQVYYEMNNAKTNAKNVRPGVGGGWAGSWIESDKNTGNAKPFASKIPKQTQESEHTLMVEEGNKTTYWDLRDPDNPKSTSKEQYDQIRLLDAGVAPEDFNWLTRVEMTASGGVENFLEGMKRTGYEADFQTGAYRRVDELGGMAVPNDEYLKYHDDIGRVTDQEGWDKYLEKRRAEDREKSQELAAEQDLINQKLEAAKIGAGELGEFGLDMLGTGVQMVPGIAGSMAIGAVAPGAAFMGFATPMYAQTYGNEYNNAILDGATEEEAAQVAALNATVEVLSEALFAAGPTMGKLTGVKRGIIPRMTKQEAKEYSMGLLKTTAGKDIKTGLSMLFKSGGEEGMEEIVAGLIQPAINQATYGEDGIDWKANFKEALYNGLVGAAMGGMGGAVDVGKAIRSGAKVKKTNQIDELIKTASTMSEEGKAFQLARRMESDKENVGRADLGYLKRYIAEEQQEMAESAAAAMRKDQAAMKNDGLAPKTMSEERAYLLNRELGNEADSFDGRGKAYGDVYEKAYALALEKYEGEGEANAEELADQLARSVARLSTGEGYADFSSFHTNDSTAREVFEKATGKTLPATNAETAEFLQDYNYKRAYATTKADNEREQLDLEQAVQTYKERFLMSLEIGKGSDADKAFQLISQDVPDEDFERAGMTFKRMYDIGYKAAMSGGNVESFVPLNEAMYDALDESQQRVAFEQGFKAGEQAQEQAKEQAKNVIEALGELEAKKKSGKKVRKAGRADTSNLTKEDFNDEKKSVIIKIGKRIANRTRTTIVFESLESIKARFGEFEEGVVPNGWYENGEIHIYIDGSDPLLATFSHEFTHHIARLAPEEYLELQNFIVQSKYNGDKNEWIKAIDGKMRQYGRDKKTMLKSRDDAIEELIADMAHEFLNDEQTIIDLFNYNQKVYEGLKKVITKLINQFLDYIGEVDKAGIKVGIESGLNEEQLLKARELWLNAAKVAKQRGTVALNRDAAAESGMKFMLGNTTNGRKVVIITEDYLSGYDTTSTKSVRRYLEDNLKKLVGSHHEILSDAEMVYIGEDFPGEFLYSDDEQRLYDRERKTLKAKMAASQNIPEFFEVAVNPSGPEVSTDSKHNKDAKYGFYRYEIGFAIPIFNNERSEIVDFRLYNAQMLLRHDADGKKYLYDFVNIKRDKTGELPSSLLEEIGRNVPTYLTLSIRNNPKGVKYSLSSSAKMDADYLDAVNRGDMETAQRMVDEAAERAGYTSTSDYQGTSAFNGEAPGPMYYESKEERKEAWDNDEYDDNQTLGDYVDNGVDLMNLDFFLNDSRAIRNRFMQESISNLRTAVRNGKKTITMYRSVPSNIAEDSFRNGDWITPSRSYAIENAEVHGWGDAGQYRIIEQEVSIDDIWWDGNDINEWGYNDGTEYVYKNTTNNRKLPVVTFDDSGNVIPLSQRFDENNPDIRFSISPAVQHSATMSEAKAILDRANKNYLHRNGYNYEDGEQLLAEEGVDGVMRYSDSSMMQMFGDAVGSYRRIVRLEDVLEAYRKNKLIGHDRNLDEWELPGIYEPRLTPAQRRELDSRILTRRVADKLEDGVPKKYIISTWDSHYVCDTISATDYEVTKQIPNDDAHRKYIKEIENELDAEPERTSSRVKEIEDSERNYNWDHVVNTDGRESRPVVGLDRGQPGTGMEGRGQHHQSSRGDIRREEEQGGRLPVTHAVSEDEPDINFSLPSPEQTERQAMERRIERLQRDKRLTHGLEPKSNQVAKVVRRIKKDYSSDYSLNKSIDAIKDIFKMVKSGDEFSEIYGAVQDLARSIADASFVMRDVDRNMEAVDLRSYFKDNANTGKVMTIRINEQDIGDFDKVGGLKEFRKQIRGVARISTTEGMEADAVMGEIVDFFGAQWDYFENSKGSYIDGLIDALTLASSDEAKAEPQEKVYKSDDRDLQELSYVDPSEWDNLGVLSEIREDEVNMIIDEIFDAVETIIEPDLTFADRKKAEKERAIRRLKEDKKEALKILRETKNAKIDELKKEKTQVVKDTRAAERDRANRLLKLERERQRQKEADRRERGRKTQSIRRIEKIAQRLAQKLLTPSDTRHIPERYRKAIATALASLDFESTRTDKWEEKFGHPSKRIANFRDLKDEYKKIMDQDDGTLEMDEDIYNMIEELSERADGMRLSDMSPEQVETVRVLLQAIEYQVNNANKMLTEGLKETRAETAKQLHDELQAQKGEKLTDTVMKQWVKSDSTPVHFFDRLGVGVFKKIYAALTKAQDTHIRHMDEAMKVIEGITEEAGAKNIKKWSTIAKSHKLSNGTEVEMTDAQIMSLYALNQREQARGHILGSGIVIKPLKVKRSLKGKISEREASKLTRTRVKLTYEDVMSLVNSLSDAQIKAADDMLAYMRTTSEWGNETSMKLYGYKKFTEQNYFPIQSAQEYIAGTSIDPAKKSPKMWNAGFTKAVKTGANNPVMLDDFFDVATAHINQMSQYNSFTPVLQDMDRIYHHIERNDMGETEWSVKELIQQKHGIEAAKYIEQLMEDINGNLRRESNDLVMLEGLLRNWKAAKIGLSLRVLAQQPTAVVRALYEIDAKYFMGKPISKKARQRMWDIAPIALWKHWGYSQTDIHRSMRDTMMGNKGIKDKLFFDMYGKADDIGWTAIFMAVERETQAEHPELEYDSPEYREHVNNRFREIVDRTQVVDSVLHRSQMMRSQNTLMKAATAFMAEPTLTINTVVTGMNKAIEAKKAGNTKEAAKIMTRTGTVFFMNAVAVSLMASLVSTMRETFRGDDDDDDEEQNWIDSVLEKAGFEEGSFMRDWLSGYFIDDFESNINPLNMIPFVKDIMSHLEGYDSPNPTYALMYEMLDTGKDLFDWMKDPSDKRYSGTYYIERSIEKAAELFGIPASNIRKEVDSATNMFFRILGEKEYGDYIEDRLWLNDDYKGNKNVFIDHYVNAKIHGHEESAADILEKLKGAGITDEDIEKRAWKIAAPDFEDSVLAGKNTSVEEQNLRALGLTQDEIDEKKAGYLEKAVKEAAEDRDTGRMNTFENRLKNEYGYGDYDVDKLVKSAAMGEAYDLIDEGDNSGADQYINYIVNNTDYTRDDIESSILNHYTGDYYDAIDSGDTQGQQRLRSTLYRYGVTEAELQEKEAYHYKDYYRQKAYLAYSRGDKATAYQIAQQYASRYPGVYKKGAAGMIYGLDNLSPETVKKYESSGKYSNWQIP